MTIRADADGFLYRTASKSEAKRIEYQQKPPYYTSSYLKELLIEVEANYTEEARINNPVYTRLAKVVKDLREQG